MIFVVTEAKAAPDPTNGEEAPFRSERGGGAGVTPPRHFEVGGSAPSFKKDRGRRGGAGGERERVRQEGAGLQGERNAEIQQNGPVLLRRP